MTAGEKAADLLAKAVRELLDSQSQRGITPAGYSMVATEQLDELAEALDDYTALIDLESTDD